MIISEVLSDIKIDLPAVRAAANPIRRNRCRLDFMKFCMTYFKKIFYNPLTFQNEFVADIQTLLLAKASKKMARAAMRGGGKTSISVLASLWCICYKHKQCIVWYCVNETKAKERLDIVQDQLMNNPFLREDFPEICDELEKWQDNWTDDGKQFSNGVWILGKGIDGANLGTLKLGVRPDFSIIDDPEDTSTVKKTSTSTQSITAQKRFDRIDKEICFSAQLGGNASFLMVTTIRSRGCLSDEYTDPDTKPAWEGKVYSAITFLPNEARDNHWKKYMALCGAKDCGQVPLPDEYDIKGGNDEIADFCDIAREKYAAFAPRLQQALRYYAAHKEAMKEGIIETDPLRIPVWDFHWQVGSDARGREIVWSELQNTPLPDAFTSQLRLDEKELAKLIVNERPFEPKRVLCAVSMGLAELHYEFRGVDGNKRHLIECGIEQVQPGAMDSALTDALKKIKTKSTRFNVPVFGCIDAGGDSGDKSEWSELVMQFCYSNRPWLAFFKYNWTDFQLQSAQGKNWSFRKENNPYGLVSWNANHYKNRLAASYNSTEKPITFQNTESDESKAALWLYCRHQCSEQFTREFVPDKDASKSHVEIWAPMPKYRGLGAWWNTASMIECLAEITDGQQPKANTQSTMQGNLIQNTSRSRRRF